MRVINGRAAEARVYFWHCLAAVRPGVELPVFSKPGELEVDVSHLSGSEHLLIIEEGRRQLDRQLTDLERLRARSATLVTIALAEFALLSSGSRRVFEQEWLPKAAWWVAAVAAVAGLAGAVAVLTGRSEFGRSDTRMTAELESPIIGALARTYADSVGIGEATVAAKLTVLRDAVLLLVLSALVYGVTWVAIL